MYVWAHAFFHGLSVSAPIECDSLAAMFGALVPRGRELLLGLMIATVVLSVGCTRDGILEVEVELPAGPTDRYAVVQFETGEVPFDAVWARADEYPGTQLGAPQTVAYSVIGESDSTVIRMKVSFCTTPDCSGLDDAPDRVPALWYEFPRALYIGERTRWTALIDTLPADPPDAPTEIDRCEIEGCIDAPDSTTTFCRLSGEHYCE